MWRGGAYAIYRFCFAGAIICAAIIVALTLIFAHVSEWVQGIALGALVALMIWYAGWIFKFVLTGESTIVRAEREGDEKTNGRNESRLT